MFLQVNRHLRDFVEASPYIAHRTELFAAGLVDNPASKLTLASKREAYDVNRTRWDKFRPAKKWEGTVGANLGGHRTRALGVYAFVADSSKFVEFFTLESVSRSIPRKTWRIPLPDYSFSNFAMNPQADIVAIAVERTPG